MKSSFPICLTEPAKPFLRHTETINWPWKEAHNEREHKKPAGTHSAEPRPAYCPHGGCGDRERR